HLRATAPSRDVPAVRRLRGEGAAHAAREGGARDGRLGAATSHLPLPAHGMSAVPPHIAVVGGGFAGLAAAIRLARGGARVTLRVPGPFQAPAALLRYRLLSPGDRLRLLVGAVRLAARPVASLREHTVAAALAMAGQSAAACARFWHPLAIATLNEAPEVAAAAPFAAVLRKAFFAGARAARFGLARVPLSELYTIDARRTLEQAGGTVVTGAAVATL